MSDKMFILLSNILLDKSYILLPHSVLYAHGSWCTGFGACFSLHNICCPTILTQDSL